MSENARKDPVSSSAASGAIEQLERTEQFQALLRDGRGSGMPEAEVFDQDGGFWVFGYGSLLWNPGVTYDARRDAALPGYRRAFCLWSLTYRGSPEDPGLLLGIQPREGAATRGVAFHVPAEHAADGLAHLRERELVTSAYFEHRVELRTDEGGAALSAITYVVDTAHPQYAHGMELEEQARIIARCRGLRGSNAEYLFNTIAHVREAELSGADVEEMYALEERVRELLGEQTCP